MWEQFVLISKKALKKKQFHPENVSRKWHLRDPTFQNIPGGGCPQTPYDYTTCWADEHMATLPPKFLDLYTV